MVGVSVASTLPLRRHRYNPNRARLGRDALHVKECDVERTRRFRRPRFKPEEAVEPDLMLVTAVAGLLSVMSGIPDQPPELRQMSVQDAMQFASTIRDADALAF